MRRRECMCVRGIRFSGLGCPDERPLLYLENLMMWVMLGLQRLALTDASASHNLLSFPRGMTLPRASVFVTTKVNARSHSLKETPKAIRQSLTRLGLDYIDLYLLHDAISGRERRLVAWKCLVDYRDRGLVRSIGVSNWGVRHLEELVDEGLDLPVVNQIELHPWCQQVGRDGEHQGSARRQTLTSPLILFYRPPPQREIVEYCQSNGIVIQAYCPLVRGERLGDPTLHTVSQHVGKSPAQVLLRWSMQRGFCPVVKSDTTSRIGKSSTATATVGAGR